MDTFKDNLDVAQLLGDHLGVSALVFIAVLTMVIGASSLVFGRDPIQRRLTAGSEAARARAAAPSQLRSSTTKREGFNRFWMPQQAEHSKVRGLLFKAGYRHATAVHNYYALRAVLGLVVPLGIGLAFPLISRSTSPDVVILITCILIAIGFYGPVLWVTRQIQRRRAAVRDGFPDALDVLVVCVESGLGLDAALDRVGQEIGRAHPVIAEELQFSGLELRAGKGRMDVLQDFAKRVGVDDVSAFVAVLRQSDRYGTSTAEAIRVYSAEMRSKRLMRAEEKANKLPVKMALGAILFTLPPVFIVLISPAMVAVFRMLNLLIG